MPELMRGSSSYKSLEQMQQSRELLQLSLAAVPLRSPVVIYIEKSSEDGTIFRQALPSTSCAESRCNFAPSQPSRRSEYRATALSAIMRHKNNDNTAKNRKRAA
jgi:hypothetical protein